MITDYSARYLALTSKTQLRRVKAKWSQLIKVSSLSKLTEAFCRNHLQTIALWWTHLLTSWPSSKGSLRCKLPSAKGRWSSSAKQNRQSKRLTSASQDLWSCSCLYELIYDFIHTGKIQQWFIHLNLPKNSSKGKIKTRSFASKFKIWDILMRRLASRF